jgi:hypothetical protein
MKILFSPTKTGQYTFLVFTGPWHESLNLAVEKVAIP